MAILPNGEENTVIRFGAAPEVAYECENMQAAKYDHTKPTCNLLEGEGENILKNIPLVAQLQGVLHQKGGQTSREAGEGDPHEMQDSWQSPDEAQKIEAEGRETFNDSPMPALEIILKTSPSGSEGEEGLALIDRGSSINLISRTTLRKLIIKQENFTWDDLSAQEDREMPSIHVQGRKEAKAIAYIQLSLLIQQEKGPIEAGKVSFFVVEGLPVDVVIGNMTMKTWQATLEWDSRIFTITPEGKGEKSNVEWAPVYGKHWRAALPVKAHRDTCIPAYSHSKVAIFPITREELYKHGAEGDFGMISPREEPDALEQHMARRNRACNGYKSLTTAHKKF